MLRIEIEKSLNNFQLCASLLLDAPTTGLYGPSGSGKTTLLDCISGLKKPDRGQIIRNGRVLFSSIQEIFLAPEKRRIGYVSQDEWLFPHLIVRENLNYGYDLLSSKHRRFSFQHVVELLELGSLLDTYPKFLSGGERRRVALGRAIVRQPKVFLFDEPLSNLDAKLRVEMRREIKKLHKRLKTTIVYVTHDQTEAMSLGTNIAIMDQGKIQQCDTPKNIYNKPQNMFVADFIGSPSMNLLEGSLNNKIFKPNGSDNVQIPLEKYNFINKNIDNESIFLGIRPEHVYFEKVNEDCFGIKLKSEIIEYTGHEQIITFNFSGQQFLGKFSSTIDIQMDKELDLYIDLNQISLFDKNTQNRI